MDKIQAMDNMPRPSSLRKLLNRIQGLSIWMHLFRGMFPSSDRKWRGKCDLCNLLHRGTLRRENKPASKPRG
ncbi:unnamed protein product [Lepeophtheirus salmonis]|uniref:(salmon louse) hypothetical protein n=1 Tax=Lepeophtheirus salmonis TaxID=72036 RepID=A0A7R8HDB3_LEPSM|nr:unnamed protein product [Lepeophtheirus salmonis]CAF3030736.1 unnamed protein product [Lepeophtheirus salmonis]